MEIEEMIAGFTALMKFQRYSYNSIRIYRNAVASFLASIHQIDLFKSPPELLQKYFESNIIQDNTSASYNCQAAAAIKLFCKEILKKEVHLNYPKNRVHRLPVILSAEQVKILLLKVKNIKHRALLSLVYSAGLRLNEIISIKKESVDLSNKLINITMLNGIKHRQLMLSEKMLALLNEYFKSYKPNYWLFETNQYTQYSPRTVQQIFKNALLTSGLKCEATVQTLRHSFAVHMLEEGIDIRIIQKLLGHKSVKSTLIYTRLSSLNLAKIKNPFDMI